MNIEYIWFDNIIKLIYEKNLPLNNIRFSRGDLIMIGMFSFYKENIYVLIF